MPVIGIKSNLGDSRIVNQIERKYRIKVLCLERRQVANELVVRFYVSRQEYFEWWRRQSKLIPPWVTHWYQFRDNVVVYLKGNATKKLVGEAIKRAGSRAELARQLEVMGEGVSKSRNYIRQVSSDEGFVSKEGQYVGYGRALDITGFLSPKQMRWIESNLEWKVGKGRLEGQKYVLLTEDVKESLPSGLIDVIKLNPPRLLLNEVELMDYSFGLRGKTEPTRLYKTTQGYSVMWYSYLYRKDIIERFYNEINFSLQRKRQKLEELVRGSKKRIDLLPPSRTTCNEKE